MYGVVEISGHQYKVSAGEIVDVQKLDVELNSEVELDKVLFVSGDEPLIGKPIIDGAKIKAKVIKQDRSRKVFFMKRKPGLYRKRKGHRQHFTGLLITEIDNGQGQTEKIPADSKNAKKFLK